MTALPAIEAATRAHFRDAGRSKLRRQAIVYEPDWRDLKHWMFESRKGAIARSLVREQPGNPEYTRRLCHALWHDLDAARGLVKRGYQAGMRRDELKRLFACWCWRYRKLARAAVAEAAE